MRVTALWATLLGYLLVAAVCFAGLRWAEPVRVAGASMQPALWAGDLVLVSRDTEVPVGQVALLRAPGHGPVLHRVVERRTDGSVLTKGDANVHADLTPTERRHIAGRVVAVVPVGRMLARWRGLPGCDTLSAQPNSAPR
jgi:signal peptidase I